MTKKLTTASTITEETTLAMDLALVGPQNRSLTGSGSPSPRVPVVHNTGTPVKMYNFSLSDVVGYLFNHSEVKSVNIDDKIALSTYANSSGTDCVVCNEHPKGKCSKHKHLETLRILKSPEIKYHPTVPRALNSFPSEVELCTSSVPGKRYGVRALQNIPEGTWIGPYEGKHIRPEDITPETDTSYMWEIFQDGNLVYYLDGSDETKSSWMRYISCARYKEEQNTSVMQYFGNIYYRVFKDIPPGVEILVWYDDACPHYLGIPLKMQDIGVTTTSKSRALTPSEAISLPSLPPRTNTGNPPTTSISRQTIISSMQMQSGQEYSHQYPSQPATHDPLKGYRNNPLFISYDVILPRTDGNISDSHLKNYNDAYPKTPLNGKIISCSSNKNESTTTIMTNSNSNEPLISHLAKPYSLDTAIDQSKTARSRDLGIQPSKRTLDDMNLKNGALDQNGNYEKEIFGKRDIVPEKELGRHKMLMASTDRTINKFLSQIEEARNEQIKEKEAQEEEEEKDKECTNYAKRVEDDLESEISIWKCGQCEKSFAQQQILQLHICPCVPEKPYQCTYCKEAFAQPSELRTHAVIHSGKKPFKCGFCSRLFAGSTTLNNHIRTHTGERPFGCEKCGRAFSQASQLSRHRRTIFECI